MCDGMANRSKWGSSGRGRRGSRPGRNAVRARGPRSRLASGLAQGPVAKQDEADPGQLADDSAAASIRTSKPFSGLSRPAAPTMHRGGRGNIASSSPRSAGSGRANRSTRIALWITAIFSPARRPGGPCAAWPFGDADDAVHRPQHAAVEPFVEPHAEALARPASRDGNDGNPQPPGGQQAQQVGLVAVAAEHVGLQGPQQVRSVLSGRRQQPGRVVLQCDGVEAFLPGTIQESAAQAAFGEETGTSLHTPAQARGQSEHLPLGPAEESGGG